MALINITRDDGLTMEAVDESLLARTVGFEDRQDPPEFVVWVEWRLSGQLVRRDAHVILKQSSVVATAIVGGL